MEIKKMTTYAPEGTVAMSRSFSFGLTAFSSIGFDGLFTRRVIAY